MWAGSASCGQVLHRVGGVYSWRTDSGVWGSFKRRRDLKTSFGIQRMGGRGESRGVQLVGGICMMCRSLDPWGTDSRLPDGFGVSEHLSKLRGAINRKRGEDRGGGA